MTVLFADLAGSTAFEEIVDAETAREVIGRYHELLRSTVERHRVGVTKYIGDGFMAVWGVPGDREPTTPAGRSTPQSNSRSALSGWPGRG